MRNPCATALGAVVLLVVTGLSGCGSESSADPGPDSVSSTAGPPSVTIEPGPGAKNVATDTKVSVKVRNGKLTEVRVTDEDNRDLEGTLSPDGSSWLADVPVRIDTRYRVEAWATGADGLETEKASTFGTKDIEKSGTLEIGSITPKDGEKVGVGHPIVVAFNQPVANRKIVQSALRVTTTPAVEGAWYWVDDQHVHFRPHEFWPADTKVKVEARIAERSAGAGIVGGANKNSEFTIGRHQVITVDTKARKLKIVRDGKVIKQFDVSTGKPGWETRDGIKIFMDKVGRKKWTNEAIAASEDYTEHSQYAIRLTNSGEFIHDAPWNKNNIGEANASHGCIGLLTKDMRWIWEHSLLGDPIEVTGSPREHHDLTNRYADWNISWATWKKGNAG